MRYQTVSILWLLGVAGVGVSAMFSADSQFRHHFISRELSIAEKSVGDYGLTALVDVDRDGDIDICSKPWGPRAWNGVGGKMHVDFLENLQKP